ncbi:MAG: (Na+)-NQR maturation NqrM [Candidatus Competibacteraceae bacterium]|jgi:hypothetical protein|nr:(Na+)-NQR maturation NqrM [Candidatus Competibacteraceae bacterium]
MTIWLMTFLLMLIAVTGMAIGVVFKREPIKGSCGGLNQFKGFECACDDPCEARKLAMQAADNRSD